MWRVFHFPNSHVIAHTTSTVVNYSVTCVRTMQTTFSTTFILRTAKTRDGLTPIYCHITVAGDRAEFSINRSISEKNWDAGKVRGTNEDAGTLNSYLKDIGNVSSGVYC